MKGVIVAVGIMTGYAWVTAGAAPFSTLSYLLVAAPCLVFVVVYVRLGGLSVTHVEVSEYVPRKVREVPPSSIAPWIALLAAVVALEAVGLLLGGRSTSVPTLSTTVDHLLAVRWERCLLCLAWLTVGGFPLLGLRRLIRVREP